MTELPQEVLGSVPGAAGILLEQGVLGALLVLSLIGNVALVVALIRCWRFHRGASSHDDFA